MTLNQLATRFSFICIMAATLSCAPKISDKVKADMTSIKNDLVDNYQAIETLQSKYRTYQFYESTFTKNNANNQWEKTALGLKKNEVSNIISEKDKSCAIVKLDNVQNLPKIRVSYIYLNDFTNKGSELADKILKEYKSGTNFIQLHTQYNKDTNNNPGGDIGLQNGNYFVSDFLNAVQNHKKGEVFKAYVKEYGWYIINKTHDDQSITEYHIIAVKKENCN